MNVIVTGASRGIGRAITEALATRGANLFLIARQKGPLDSCIAELREQWPNLKIAGFPADLSGREAADSAAAKALEHLDQVDLLINNAGSFAPGGVHDEPPGRLEDMLGSNLYSAYHLTRAVVPGMKERGNGRIVNMCSVAGLRPYAGGGSYGVAKYALNGFSQNLREELKEFGIGVTTVYPGATLTGSWEGTELPASRFMAPEDIADAVVSAVTLSERTVVEELVLRPQLGDL